MKPTTAGNGEEALPEGLHRRAPSEAEEEPQIGSRTRSAIPKEGQHRTEQ
jgi:hypothetical protein